MDLPNPYVWACLLVTVGFGLIGFLDDYDKVKKAHHAGLSGKTRLALEFLIAGFATWLIVRIGNTNLYLPFVQGPVIDLGWFYIAFGAFVIVAFGNAVNLTDGLDGLATMPVIIASIAFLLIAYLVGNARFAEYLGIPHILGRRRPDRPVPRDRRRGPRLPVVQRAAGGGVHGRHRQPRAWRRARRGRGRDPPRVRAGDRRRAVRARGGVGRDPGLGSSAPASASSGWRRSTTISSIWAGREPTVVIRFWIISFILALAGLSTLKLR